MISFLGGVLVGIWLCLFGAYCVLMLVHLAPRIKLPVVKQPHRVPEPQKEAA